jgi:hypothetical protein
MRVAVVGWLVLTETEVLDLAAAQAEVSHDHRSLGRLSAIPMNLRRCSHGARKGVLSLQSTRATRSTRFARLSRIWSQGRSSAK